MTADRKTLLEQQANQLRSTGKLREALKAYEELAAIAPTVARWHYEAGELHNRLGDKKRAAEAFVRSSWAYAEDGKLFKAIVACKRASELDPQHEETQRKLAEHYVRRMETPQKRSAAGVTFSDAPPAKQEQPAASVMVDEALIAEAAAAQRPRAPIEGKARSAPQTLDSVTLRDRVPGARPAPLVRIGRGRIFEIPVEEVANAALVETILDTSAQTLVEIPRIPLFSSLDAATLQTIIDQVRIQTYRPGQVIIQEGQTGDRLYVVAKGAVRVFTGEQQPVELTRLHEGAFFGEIALLTNSRRTATVEAVTEVTTIEITRKMTLNLIEQHPPVLVALLRFFRDRLIDKLLRTSYLFAPFTSRERQQLASHFDFIEVEPATELQVADEPVDEMYILLCGELHAVGPPTAEGDDAKKTPIELGSVFGASALVAGDSADVSVVTQTKCWLLKMNRETFRQVAEQFPQLISFIGSLAEQDAGGAGAAGEDDAESSGQTTQQIRLPLY